MSTARAGVFSQPPKVVIAPIDRSAKKKLDPIITAEELNKILPNYTDENKKYIKVWECDDYRKYSPGEQCLDMFFEAAEPEKGITVIDWGCGTGRAALKISEHGLDCTAVDFAYNALDKEVKAKTKNNPLFRFVEHDITQPTDLTAQLGFCTDVMEHLPTDEVDAAVQAGRMFHQDDPCLDWQMANVVRRANRELATLKAMYNRLRKLKRYEGVNPVVGIQFLEESKGKLRFPFLVGVGPMCPFAAIRHVSGRSPLRRGLHVRRCPWPAPIARRYPAT